MVSAKDNKEAAGVHVDNVKWDDATSRKLFNVNDGLTGRDGGPYLDEEEQRAAEVRRAAVEGRAPDFKTPGPTAGTVLVTGKRLLQTENVPNIPSQDDKNVIAATIAKHVDGDSFLPRSYEELPDQKEIDKVLDEVRSDNRVESPMPSDSTSEPVPVKDTDAQNTSGDQTSGDNTSEGEGFTLEDENK